MRPRAQQETRAEPGRSPDGSKKRFDTVAFVDEHASRARAPAAIAVAGGERAATSASQRPASISTAARAPLKLELLLERTEDPTPGNPLSYRECAYLLPKGTTVSEAEAALRWKLAELQRELEATPRGRLINLAVFDHTWNDAPERPPVIVLQWRDWRDEIVVDYPAAARSSSVPSQASAPHDDRLADVFEALEDLPRLHTVAEGLDFAVQLLERMIPAEATSACLYDINTDELRFVAVSGTSAPSLQGQAVPRGQGLFGQALRSEHHASVFNDLAVEPAFNPASDSRPELDARNALLRPIVHEHQLLGLLQLINRKGATAFTAQDLSVINYIAERLADFVYAARLRQRGHA
jgi:hypothetical protein